MGKYFYTNEPYIKEIIRNKVVRIIAYYVCSNSWATIECRIAIVRNSNHIFGGLIKQNTTINSIISTIRNNFVVDGISPLSLSKCRTIEDVVTYVYQALISPANKGRIRTMEYQGLLRENSNGIK
jgi:hypothetical protein